MHDQNGKLIEEGDKVCWLINQLVQGHVSKMSRLTQTAPDGTPLQTIEVNIQIRWTVPLAMPQMPFTMFVVEKGVERKSDLVTQ